MLQRVAVIPRLAVGSTVHPRTFGTVLYRGLADGAQLPAIINHGLRQVLSEGLSFASTGLKFTEAAPQPQFVLPTTSRVISSNNRQVVDIESLAQNDGSSSPYGALLQYTKLTQGQKRNAQASSKNVASDDAYEAVLTYAKMNV